MPNGYFYPQVLLKTKKDDVVNKLIGSGFEIEEVNIQGEWVCIIGKLK